jgi:hypothetical protein
MCSTGGLRGFNTFWCQRRSVTYVILEIKSPITICCLDEGREQIHWRFRNPVLKCKLCLQLPSRSTLLLATQITISGSKSDAKGIASPLLQSWPSTEMRWQLKSDKMAKPASESREQQPAALVIIHSWSTEESTGGHRQLFNTSQRLPEVLETTNLELRAELRTKSTGRINSW